MALFLCEKKEGRKKKKSVLVLVPVTEKADQFHASSPNKV